jgi:hypothetical protein
MMGIFLKLRFVVTVVVILFFSSLGIAQDDMTFGSKVVSYDMDEGKTLCPFYMGPEFVFVDGNIKGQFDEGDPVYIHFDRSSPTINENDARITPLGIFAAGSQVKMTDVDHGNAITRFGTNGAPAVELRYFDVDGDKSYSLNDPIYLDLIPGKVTAGDIRITGYKDYAAGSRVRNSDVDSDKPLMTLPGMLSFFNSLGNINSVGWGIYDEGDIVYIDTQYPFNQITVNDVRISISSLSMSVDQA